MGCVGFTYKLGRLKPRVSKYRRHPAKVETLFTSQAFRTYAVITNCSLQTTFQSVSWGYGIGRGLTSGEAYGLSLSKSVTAHRGKS